MVHGRAGRIRPSTLAQKQKIRDLFDKGHSDEEIAELIGRSVWTVRQTTRFMEREERQDEA